MAQLLGELCCGRRGNGRAPLGAVWHPWQRLANTVTSARAFLQSFAARGASNWRDVSLAPEERKFLSGLHLVQEQLASFDEEVRNEPDAFPDAVEAAVMAAVMCLADPQRTAALRYFGISADARGLGKTEREDLAASLFNRRGRWFRTRSAALGGEDPRTWLLHLVADRLADGATEPVQPDLAAMRAPSTALPSTVAAGPEEPDFVCVWSSFPYERVAAGIAAATERIRILQTWVPDLQPFIGCISAAVKRGASLEILILRPGCVAASQRLVSLGIEDAGYPSIHARKLMREMKRLEQYGLDWRASIRTYETPPVAQLYGTEEHLWLGLFWSDQFSMQAPQVEVSVKESTLGRALSLHFDALWASSPPLDPAELER